MLGRRILLSLGLAAGGVVVLGEATYILVAAIGEPTGVFGFTVGDLPIGVPIAIVSVLVAVGMIYVGVSESDRVLA